MAGTMKRALFAGRIALGVAVSAFGASDAFAVPLLFTFTGNGNTYVTTIDSNPVPVAFPNGATILSTSGTLNGAPASGFSTVFFRPGAVPNYDYGNAFTFDDSFTNLYTVSSPLYAGTDENPIFSVGTFDGIKYNGSDAGRLVISSIGGGGGPGVPAPEVGGGLLAALAALGAFGLTRMRGFPRKRAAA